MDRLMGRMGTEPILSVKQSVSIGTMLNFDGDGDGHGDGTCKQTLRSRTNTDLMVHIAGFQLVREREATLEEHGA